MKASVRRFVRRRAGQRCEYCRLHESETPRPSCLAASKWSAYALGRSLTLGDTEAADAMVPALRTRKDRLPALIELITASEPFLSK